MARCNVFVRAGNDNRDVSIGGRARSDSGFAHLNTDNASQSDCGIKVRAEVVGTVRSEDRRKPGSDTRKSVFTVELPDQTDEFCEVNIVEHGHALANLARIGVALCMVKGLTEIAQGEQKQGKMTIKAAKKILAELEAEKGKYPTVNLPGGVTLQHALACVQIVQGLIHDQPKN